MSASGRPRIAVTMGDPAGVGPELCLRALADDALAEICTPVVFGDAGVLRRAGAACGLAMPARVFTDDAALERAAAPAVYDLRAMDATAVRPGTVDAATGAAACRYIETAVDAALAGRVAAVCTAPIHKEALHAAGVPYPGHTELLAARTGARRHCMMLTADALTCSLVTTHLGYREAADALSVERIAMVIELTADAMRRLLGREPRLAVCGLNPHAGEHGLFGTGEEERIIRPAVECAARGGLQVDGPLPPDTAFVSARRARTDAYVCMYHDQGLIPLKLLAFERAVNVTLGLPIVRTSVDHGTALDLAWQGKADSRSLFAAIRLAVRLGGRGESQGGDGTRPRRTE